MPGVIERRQNAPFVEKALQHAPRSTMSPTDDHFDRDQLVKPVVVSSGEVDDAHAAASQFALNPIGTESCRTLCGQRSP